MLSLKIFDNGNSSNKKSCFHLFFSLKINKIFICTGKFSSVRATCIQMCRLMIPTLTTFYFIFHFFYSFFLSFVYCDYCLRPITEEKKFFLLYICLPRFKENDEDGGGSDDDNGSGDHNDKALKIFSTFYWPQKYFNCSLNSLRLLLFGVYDKKKKENNERIFPHHKFLSFFF